MYSVSLRGALPSFRSSLLFSLLSPPLSLSRELLSLSREEEEEQEKKNAENVGTKGAEKVPAQEDGKERGLAWLPSSRAWYPDTLAGGPYTPTSSPLGPTGPAAYEER